MSDIKERFVIEFKEDGFYSGIDDVTTVMFCDDIDEAKNFKSKKKAIERAYELQLMLPENPGFRILTRTWVMEESQYTEPWQRYISPEERAEAERQSKIPITLESLGIKKADLQKKQQLTKLQFITAINNVLSDAAPDEKPTQTDLNNWWKEYQQNPAKYDWIK